MNYDFDLSEMEFRILRDFIHDRFGIFIKDEKRSFVRMKLYPRVTALGLNTYGEYLNFVRFGPRGDGELSKMISLLTNNETYFFREVPQLTLFRDVLLGELRDKKIARGERKLRILSAGCSTGEEVYTLAMLIFETGSFFWDWDVQVIGIDISETALECARSGAYFDRSFRMTDPVYLQKFFSKNSGDYLVKENIKKMASFVRGNIFDQTIWETIKDIDILFCRNVLIYFSEEKFNLAINNFYKTLRNGGYLLLGHSENLSGIITDFETLRLPGTLAYQKKES